MVKGLKFTQTGNYTILAKNDAGNSSKTVDVNVMGRVLSQVNMLICRTIFQHRPVIPVLFFAHIQRFSRSNESTVLFLNALMVYFFKAEKHVSNIVVYSVT